MPGVADSEASGLSFCFVRAVTVTEEEGLPVSLSICL